MMMMMRRRRIMMIMMMMMMINSCCLCSNRIEGRLESPTNAEWSHQPSECISYVGSGGDLSDEWEMEWKS